MDVLWGYCMVGNTRILRIQKDTCKAGNKKQKSRELEKIKDRLNLTLLFEISKILHLKDYRLLG